MEHAKFLCIGRSKLIVKPLVKKLIEAGFDAWGTTKVNEAEEWLNTHHFDAIAFGRAVTEDVRNNMLQTARKLNSRIYTFTGLYPSVPLLLHQANHELFRHSGLPKPISIVHCHKNNGINIKLTAHEDCHLSFSLMRINWLLQAKQYNIGTQYFTGGGHTTILEHEIFNSNGAKFLIITHYGHVVHIQRVD